VGMNPQTVCVIGLGFVGLTLATKLAETRRVYGLDTNPAVASSVALGTPHFHEKGLEEALRAVVQSGRLSAHTEWSEIPSVDVYVVTVGTPILSREVSLSALQKVASELVSRVRATDLVIVRSTVKVGSTREILSSAFMDKSRLPLIAMCPERTLEGSALRELVELPQIIGGLNDESLEASSSFFESFGCKIVQVSSLEAAEFAKLMNNTYRDVQFAFANEMALVSESLGLDVREVIRAANEDYPRSNVAMPGVTGGPCLEKDPWILVESASKGGVAASITKASRELHESLPASAIHRVVKELLKNSDVEPETVQKVSVLGLAFKGEPATDDTRGSLARDVIRQLRQYFPAARISGADPEVSIEDAISIGVDELVSTSTALENATVAIVQNNHHRLKDEIILNCALPRKKPIVIFDFWGILNKEFVSESVNLITFGNGLK
jgi:UDP-N-acetyl-D-mannosaminuronic acid dehydrogenase